MTTKKTPTERLKDAQAEIKRLEKAFLTLNEETEKAKAEAANGAYTLGYDEGFRDASTIANAQRTEAGIARFFRK